MKILVVNSENEIQLFKKRQQWTILK